jgi:hypothetical protein
MGEAKRRAAEIASLKGQETNSMSLPDIEFALKSFQHALDKKEIALTKCAVDSELFLHVDKPNGEMRFTYVRLTGKRVSAMTQVVRCAPYEGEPCFNVAWAVPMEFRGVGRAVEVFKAALDEMSHGFHKAGMSAFWVEAIVGIDNKTSQRVAAKAITSDAVETTDDFAGVPVYQYLRRVECGTKA